MEKHLVDKFESWLCSECTALTYQDMLMVFVDDNGFSDVYRGDDMHLIMPEEMPGEMRAKFEEHKKKYHEYKDGAGNELYLLHPLDELEESFIDDQTDVCDECGLEYMSDDLNYYPGERGGQR
ncbi:MAG: hypothetical protein Q8M92_03960, partial [Candidatus Subteraquimicrobiales bacterium]|nr:hypothetical protein [Candidatus Subteraquimicrobiales bacterium]